MATISIVKKSRLEGRKRIDSEYYRTRYLYLENVLARQNPMPLSQLLENIRSFGAYSLTNQITYHEKGIPFVRCIDVKTGYVDFSKVLRINNETHTLLWKSEVLPNTVLLAMSGSVGNAAVASPEWMYPINSNQDIAKITTKNNLDPYFLAIFLNSKYGRYQTERLPVGSIQQHIFLWQIGLIKVPLLNSIQSTISCLAKKAEQNLVISEKKYNEAEHLLLSELDLHDWQPTRTLTYVQKYSKVERMQRIDAEHFQPKYQEMFDKLPTSLHLDRLGKLTTHIKGIEVGSPAYTNSGIPFWRVSNLTKHGLDDDTVNFISDDFYNSLRSMYEPQQGEILLSKDATPGLAYYLETPIKGIVSSGILRLTITENIPPHYLELVLNSLFVQLQIEQAAGGSIIRHWKPLEIRKTLIPRLSDEKEKNIAILVQQSHVARQEAKGILDKVKRAVELAIEESEEQAITFLNS